MANFSDQMMNLSEVFASVISRDQLHANSNIVSLAWTIKFENKFVMSSKPTGLDDDEGVNTHDWNLLNLSVKTKPTSSLTCFPHRFGTIFP